jgi:ribosomal protein L10
MNKNEKSEIISEIRKLIDNASAVYLTNYSGIPVSEITTLRNELEIILQE